METYEENCNPAVEDVFNKGLELISECVELLHSLEIGADYSSLPHIPPDVEPLTKNASKTTIGLCGLLQDVMVHIRMLGLYGGSKACLAHMIQLELLRLKADTSLTKMVLTVLISTLTVVR